MRNERGSRRPIGEALLGSRRITMHGKRLGRSISEWRHQGEEIESLIDIPSILKEIPTYEEGFKTSDELEDSSKKLMKERRFRKLVRSGFLTYDEKFGVSTEGKDIGLMTVGKGKRKVLWVGTPHPNEAVGTLAIDFLSRYLCEHPEITEKLDTTFVFIKNVDPDGLELNKSWLKGKMDPLKYALGYYRPPLKDQVEWGVPIDYKDLHFHNPSAETQTLMKALKLYEPEFYYSLHNAGFSDPYYLFTKERPVLMKPLHQVIKDQELSIYTGEPEAPFYKKYGVGFFSSPSVIDIYDHYESLNGPDININESLAGANSFEDLQRIVPSSFGLISEVPYFTADALKDATLSGKTKQQMILERVRAIKRIHAVMESRLNGLKSSPGFVADSPLTKAVEDRIEFMRAFTAGLEGESTKEEYQEEATNAEVYTAVHISSFSELIQLGQVYQLAVQSGEVIQAEEIKEYMSNEIDIINNENQIESIPLQKLVALQVGAGLTTQQQLALAA